MAASSFAQQSAQGTLPTVVLDINGRKVTAEVADDDAERSTGLMFRERIKEDAGMLFVMPSEAPVTFWMRNTILALSIAYIRADGTIMEIHDLEPKDETPVPSRFRNIAFALEMRQGWFSDAGVFPGDRIQGLAAAVNP